MLNLTPAERTQFADALAVIDTPFTLSQTITVAEIAGATLSPGFQDFTVRDTVANILAGLAQVQALAAAGQLGRLAYTDTAPRLSLSAASLMSGINAFALVDYNPYPVELTDAGTPVITLPAYLLGDYIVRNNLLDAIATPWELHVSGRVSAFAAASVAVENNGVAAHLTTDLAVAAYGFELSPYLAHLHVLDVAGHLGSIDLIDTNAPVFRLSQAEVASIGSVLARTEDSYVLTTEVGSTAKTSIPQIGRLALTGFDASYAIDIRDMAFLPAGMSFNYTGGVLQVLRNGTPVGSAGVLPANNVTYDSKSFYVDPAGPEGTRIRATQSPIAVTETSNGMNAFVTGGDFYVGVTDYLQRQFINPTIHSVNMGANIPNVFLHGGVAGNNALQVLSGRNVLDGGLGSNFLVGGLGGGPSQADTFFLDGRGGGISWGTVVNFQPGDMVTFWGWEQGVTTFDWFDNFGADGFKGATIHARLDGQGAYDASITFAGISETTARGFTMLTGDSGGNKYAQFLYNS